ncbi:MAG: DMT family transporter [Cypionkella sp.]
MEEAWGRRSVIVMPSDYRLGLLLVTASAIAWSTAGFFTRLIPLDTWTLLAWRGLIGAAGIAIAALMLDRENALRGLLRMGSAGWLYAVVSGAGMIFFITSLRHTTVAHVAVIYAAVPFVAAALAWVVLRETPPKAAISASIAAFVGVVLMVGFGQDGSLVGDGLAFGMTLCMAVMMVIARKGRNIPVMPAACMSALLSGLVCLPFGEKLAVPVTDFLLLLAFGLVNSALGLTLFTLGARRLPAIETALIGALDAPLAPIWVWIAFRETPSPITILGGLIVFAAVSAHIFSSTRSLKSTPQGG